MSRALWLGYGALLAAALALGLASGAKNDDSPVASIDNPGPRGLKVLRRWLEAEGRTIEELPDDAHLPNSGTVVIAAPTGHAWSKAEVDGLRTFVENGGTLVYLVSRTDAQPVLDEWLEVSKGPAPAPAVSVSTSLEDPGGVTVPLTFASGPLREVRALRVSNEPTVTLTNEAAVPIAARGALWWRRIGRGEAWVSAGADLAENRRLELNDNAALWAAWASQGPVMFDELHHRAWLGLKLKGQWLMAVVQLLLVALVIVLARGRRLGPPRPTAPEHHRSSLEYVEAMGALTREARVDGALGLELRAQLRRLAAEQLGLSSQVPLQSLALEVERHTTVCAADFVALDARLSNIGGPDELTAAAAQAAQLERQLMGAPSARRPQSG